MCLRRNEELCNIFPEIPEILNFCWRHQKNSKENYAKNSKSIMPPWIQLQKIPFCWENLTNKPTYFLACSSPMLLKRQSRHWGSTPGFCEEPFIVNVFPDEVTPYAKRRPSNNTARQQLAPSLTLQRQECIKSDLETMVAHLYNVKTIQETHRADRKIVTLYTLRKKCH